MQLMSHSLQGWLDQIAGLTTSLNRLFFTVTRAVKDSRFLLHANGKLRRFGLVHFRKEYVHRQLPVRKGNCRQCGTCCNLLFTCPMLTNQGMCFVYGSCRPQACRVFPIDQRDIDEVKLCGVQCGYRFSEKTPKLFILTKRPS